MSAMRALVILALGLSACANPTFRYRPEPPLSNSWISADYMVLTDRLRVEIDTGGYRLLDAQIVKGDGATVRPQTIEQPPAGSGSSVGVGFGVGGSNVGRGGGVGVGTGVGMEIPMGSGTRVQGVTVLYFALDQIGPAPWRLSATIAETNPAAVIVLPPR
jgi:hypothetical protein